MPITLTGLRNRERKLVFAWEDETAEITYRVSGYTPELESELQDKINSGLPLNGTAAILAGLLIDWDVLDDYGQALPVDMATLCKFPDDFLGELLIAISQDQKAGREDRKNSGAGSARKAASAKSRRGTR